ncbi:MAG: HAMP domain-containing histidine kinase [Clostridia bacterium]|nr:HAMP domain-containing histidine kinase [Clostridia bacterium]
MGNIWPAFAGPGLHFLNEKRKTSRAFQILIVFIAIYLLTTQLCMLVDKLPVRFGILSPNWFNIFSAGICFLLLIYSLSLYFQKRSEAYLLWLSILAALSLFRTLANSNEISILIGEHFVSAIKMPLDVFTAVVCFGLCFWITNTRLPGKLNMLLKPTGLIVLFILLLLFRFAAGDTTVQKVVASTPYYAAFGCLFLACANEKPYSYTMLSGMTIRFAVRGYLLTASNHVLAAYLIASQLDFLIFMFACLLSIDHRFVDKFNESEHLANELAQINSSLDIKVEQRTAELKKANALILTQQKNKQELMINIFHDLRSPLFVLKGYADMLRPEKQEDLHRKDRMLERLDFMSNLVEDLFLTAKLEEYGVSFYFEVVSLRQVCGHILDNFQVKAADAGISICCAPCDGYVTADEFRLRQALGNLVDNALRYTPRGGSVSLICNLEDSFAKIAVSDTGPGISEEALPHLFERYFHSSKDGNSSGLGLFIANSLITSMGGTIEAASYPGRGAVFTLRLPLAQTGL